MTDDARNSMWSDLNKSAYKKRSVTDEPISNEDMANWLRGVLGG